MMRLSTMWRVDSTHDSAGHSPVAERVLEPWPHEPQSLRFVRSSANFLYVLRQAGATSFLRFTDSAERSRAAVDAEVDIVTWLAGAGLRVALPVRSAAGSRVETVETEWGTFHAVVFAALAGSQLELDDLDPEQFRAWGAALGQLHAALQAYPGLAASARPSWWACLEQAQAYLPADASPLRREWAELSDRLNALPVTPHTRGLIHFDFELDNLVWQDASVGILDFDDCAHCWLAADVAFALQDLFDGGATLDDPRLREFVRGYADHWPLREEELSQVPLFLRLRNLLRYADLARALDVPEDPAYPEWLHTLIEKLRGRMVAYRASL
jgi:Ser/Thr protein kinase RdoA (MazF antagonist)